MRKARTWFGGRQWFITKVNTDGTVTLRREGVKIVQFNGSLWVVPSPQEVRVPERSISYTVMLN